MKNNAEIVQFPPGLPDEKLVELIKKYKETGDTKIRDQIVAGSMRLVAKFVYRHCQNVVHCLTPIYPSAEDLIQECSLKIPDCIDAFDGTRGVKFSTYLTESIKTKVGRIYDDSQAEKRSACKVSSLEEPLKKNFEKGAPTKQDNFAGHINYENSVDAALDLEYIKTKILPLFPEFEQMLFNRYYFENETQAQIARELNCTRACISQKVAEISKKVKDVYENGIDTYKPTCRGRPKKQPEKPKEK